MDQETSPDTLTRQPSRDASVQSQASATPNSVNQNRPSPTGATSTNSSVTTVHRNNLRITASIDTPTGTPRRYSHDQEEGGQQLYMEEPSSSMKEVNLSDDKEDLMIPLMMPPQPKPPKQQLTPARDADSTFRSRNKASKKKENWISKVVRRRVRANQTRRQKSILRYCCKDRIVRSTLSYMNIVARAIFWFSVVLLVLTIGWYSYELKNNGTDPHLIAWFSAGAFVLLGWPISLYGIVMHLANYNQPHIQCYIVRILWMVPIYSVESWLCLRFHQFAIYIETLRDCYESYVLYCFMQYLIQVLGGEEDLILMLKDKSPTRGVHMWGLQWCVRPWLMGQPVSRTVVTTKNPKATSSSAMSNTMKRVHWTSPFFVKCKVGVLQYVLLKFVSSIFVMMLEIAGVYKEGDFTPSGGYLYICILTNLSQCWALYCLIFFYYATKNELGPIRPVGKFLSVKALVFFTWWQSVGISMLYQADMIPHYHGADAESNSDWTSEDVAKGLQDYLICIEMFIGAIVHIFVFPHTDYLAEAVAARTRSQYKASTKWQKRLGRKHLQNPWYQNRDDRSVSSKNSGYDYDMELASQATPDNSGGIGEGAFSVGAAPVAARNATLLGPPSVRKSDSMDHSTGSLPIKEEGEADSENEDDKSEVDDDEDSDFANDSPLPQPKPKTGFVKALLDSTIPLDVMDSTVGMVKGDFVVEKKTLLHHATTSDSYDLFSSSRVYSKKAKNARSIPE